VAQLGEVPLKLPTDGTTPVETETTVFIIDHDPDSRRVLGDLVASMRLQARTYASAGEFFGAYDGSAAGCVLLDIRLPDVSGLGLIERFRQQGIPLPVIVVSAHGDVPTVVQAMKAGAVDFLEKPCREQQLWESVHEAIRRDAENRKRLARHRAVQSRLARLTEGEEDVLRRLVAGKTNRQIAEDLGLSVRTIEVRRSKVMRKMKAGSLAHLVRLALLDGQGECGLPAHS
jgi:RNA polymerase sigma factor (sigma-70 family)